MLIETPHEKRQPAATAFEKSHAQPRMAIEYPAAAKTADGEHLLDRMRIGVTQHEVVAEIVSGLARRRVVSLVKAEGHTKILERGPKRLVVGLVPVVAVD